MLRLYQLSSQLSWQHPLLRCCHRNEIHPHDLDPRDRDARHIRQDHCRVSHPAHSALLPRRGMHLAQGQPPLSTPTTPFFLRTLRNHRPNRSTLLSTSAWFASCRRLRAVLRSSRCTRRTRKNQFRGPVRIGSISRPCNHRSTHAKSQPPAFPLFLIGALMSSLSLIGAFMPEARHSNRSRTNTSIPLLYLLYCRLHAFQSSPGAPSPPHTSPRPPSPSGPCCPQRAPRQAPSRQRECRDPPAGLQRRCRAASACPSAPTPCTCTTTNDAAALVIANINARHGSMMTPKYDVIIKKRLFKPLVDNNKDGSRPNAATCHRNAIEGKRALRQILQRRAGDSSSILAPVDRLPLAREEVGFETASDSGTQRLEPLRSPCPYPSSIHSDKSSYSFCLWACLAASPDYFAQRHQQLRVYGRHDSSVLLSLYPSSHCQGTVPGPRRRNDHSTDATEKCQPGCDCQQTSEPYAIQGLGLQILWRNPNLSARFQDEQVPIFSLPAIESQLSKIYGET